MVEDIRHSITNTLGAEYAHMSHSPSSSNMVSTTAGCDEADGFEILNRVRNQLESMNSGKLKAALGLMDSAAKACH